MNLKEQGLSLLQSGKPRQALPILMKLSKQDPGFQNLLHLGAAQRACALLHEANDTLSRCAKLEPESPELWNNIAQVATDAGKFDHAVTFFRKALECTEKLKMGMDVPAVQNIMLGFAQSLMRFDKFKEAAPLWEYSRVGNSWHLLPGVPMWKGEPCQSLLVVCEGGFGDAMLFGRWLFDCSKRCKSVSLLIWDEMVNWCDWTALGVSDSVYHPKRSAAAAMSPIRGVLPISGDIVPHVYDAMISWMSFPSIFGMEEVPKYPFRELMFPWINFGDPGDSRKHVGFCWRAEETGLVRKIRTLSDSAAASIARHLAKFGEVDSLCPSGKHLHRPDDFKTPPRVNPVTLRDWRATTEMMAGLDFVVTVDTAVAHLAGILRIPTLLLLPARSDWKWGLHRDHGPWYGDKLRYFRNSNPVTWDVERIEATISQMIESKG